MFCDYAFSPLVGPLVVWAPLAPGRSLHGFPYNGPSNAPGTHTTKGRMQRAAGRCVANPRPTPLAPLHRHRLRSLLHPLRHLNAPEGDFRSRSPRKTAPNRVQADGIRPQPCSGGKKAALNRVQVPRAVSGAAPAEIPRTVPAEMPGSGAGCSAGGGADGTHRASDPAPPAARDTRSAGPR